MHEFSVPSWIKNFLPTFFIKIFVKTPVIAGIRAIRIGIMFLIYSDEIEPEMAYFPYTTIALTPDICCKRAR